jgi:hypothetical protein
LTTPDAHSGSSGTSDRRAAVEEGMRTSGFLVVVLAFLVLRPMPVRAQGVELGAGLAVSCEPFESSLCHRQWGTASAVYGNWWISDGVALELRGARLHGPQSRIIAVGEEIAPRSTFYTSYLLQSERRTLVQASLVWQFRNTQVVRPFVGVGPGVLWWKGDSSCPRSLIGCERVLPNGAPGRLEHTEVVFGFTGGVAFQAPNGVIVRSGIRGISGWNALTLQARRARQTRIEDLPRGLPEYFGSIGYRW